MGIRDEDWEGGLFEAFRSEKPGPGSVIDELRRLHGLSSSVLLREDDPAPSPVLLRRSGDDAARDDRRYRVLGEIARGGIGVVYRGHDRDLNRDVALKVLRKDHAEREDVIQRFVEEAQVGGQLQHPGIVPVYGLGLQPDGRPYFAMKLVKGRTLAELLDGNPEEIDLVAVFEQVAQTMAYAHSRGVIHRDLKPANVMVGAFGEVQVVDWGFAKILGQDETKRPADRTRIATVRSGPVGSQSVAGSVMGTPAYMSPEQAMGRSEELDERTDVFALGAILCEILTGKPPYTGEPQEQLIAAAQTRLDEAYARLDACEAEDALKALARDCLQPMTGDRPRTARAVAERISEFLASVEERARQAELDAVTAETEAVLERQARRRTLGLSAAALLILIAGGSGFLVWRVGRETRERKAGPEVERALRQAVGFEAARAWDQAASAAKRAVDVAASEGIPDRGAGEILARVTQARRDAREAARIDREDAALLADLERILALSRPAAPAPEAAREDARSGVPAAVGVSQIDRARAIDRACTAAIEQRFPTLEAAIERIEGSRHAARFAAVLGFWAWGLREREVPGATDPRRLDRMARQIAPGHANLRSAMAERDVKRVLELVPEHAGDLPRALVVEIGYFLLNEKRAQDARAFLLEQDERSPGDYRIQLLLATALGDLGEHAEALRRMTAALALGPTQPAWIAYAHCLGKAGERERAVAAARRAIDLDPAFAPAHGFLATELRYAGRLDEALAACREAIRLDPEDARSHHELAGLLDRTGDRTGALDAHRRVLALDPDHTGALNNIANRHLDEGDHARAIEGYRRCIAIDPTEALIHANLAVALNKAGDNRAAAAAARRAIEVDPGYLNGYLSLCVALGALGDVEGALAAARKGVEVAPEASIAWNNLGATLMRPGRYGEAIPAFARAVEFDPSNAGAVRGLAEALGRAHRNDEAIAMGRRALELDPTRWTTRHNLIHVLLEAGRLEEAEAESRRWIALEPASAPAHASLAHGLRQQGKYAASEAAFRAALERDPGYVPALQGLGALLCDILGRPREALVFFDRGVAAAPAAAGLRFCRAIALTNLGELDAAEVAARRAVTLAPRKRGALEWLALVLKKQGKREEAAAAYRRALALASGDTGKMCELAAEIGRLGYLDEAMATYRRVLVTEPANVSARCGIGWTLCSKGDPVASIEAYREALAIRPRDFAANWEIGVSLRADGRLDAAIAAFRTALGIEAASARVQRELAYALRDRGRLGEAVVAMHRAVELAPKETEILVDLGRLLRAATRFREAEATLRRALELDPDDASALAQLGLTLQRALRFDKARAVFEDLLRREPQHAEAASRLVEIARRRALEGAFRKVARGEFVDVTLAQRRELAHMLAEHRQWAAAATQFAAALDQVGAEDADIEFGLRYRAARAGARAGGAWHARALQWLRNLLAHHRARIPVAPGEVVARLGDWLREPDFAQIRNEEDPPEGFRQLWLDVRAALEEAREAAQ